MNLILITAVIVAVCVVAAFLIAPYLGVEMPV